MHKVLITGASGLIGTRLTDLLLQKEYQVGHMGRGRGNGTVPSYQWNVENGMMDERAFEGVSSIIHLAGANVSGKRWTEKYKKEILESRLRSTRLLLEFLKKGSHEVQSFVSASAIGYYGYGKQNQVFNEDSPAGSDFLARVVEQWESEVDLIRSFNIRVAKIRIGIVFSHSGGALVELAKPIRWGVGAILGSGQQDVSWIHLDDLCRIFMHVLENQHLHGAYNSTTLHAVTNRELTQAIAGKLKRPLLLPPVPGFALKILLGEMANVILNGSKVSSEKIRKEGFEFEFDELEAALDDLLRSKKEIPSAKSQKTNKSQTSKI